VTQSRKQRKGGVPEPVQAASSRPRLCPVVGLGASAGGLDAFQRFFPRLPSDSGMAFIVVQHLDPHHESLLPELLSKTTRLRVEQVNDGTPVEPDHVYVIPPNTMLTIEAGVLRVQPAGGDVGPRLPIDRLFCSLAEDQGHNAVCILFSGSGSDGTIGLRAVKEHGGMAMAQSPESAQHDSILRSAISTGLVDHVLLPEEIAAKLMEYATYLRQLRDQQGPEALISATSDELARICTVLLHKTGHDFRQYKTPTLIRRIQRRLQVLQAPSVAAYIERLHEVPGEADQLFRDLLIGVTHFFRDPQAFAALAHDVIPRLVEVATVDGTLRVWAPGCSTGEEAYSVAILLREEILRRDARTRVQIFAGDIDDEALEFARNARYAQGIAEHITPERLERFFIKQDHTYQVAKEIREMCVFSTHNLIKDPPFSRLDLVVCRNLLIYLEADLQRYVTSLFHYALHTGGYLFLGPAESVAGPPELFRTVDRKHRIFQRGATPTRLVESLPPVQTSLASRTPAGHGGPPGSVRSGPQDVVAALERVMLDRYAPTWVVINARAEVLHFSARTGRYLEPAPGAPSPDIVGMARRGLRLDLRTAIHKAVRTSETVVHENVVVEANGEVQRINLLVHPVTELGTEAGLFLVVFQELGPPQNREAAAAGDTAARTTDDSMIQQLESELRTTKDHLQATVEEVETSNEELKSANEELLATNEELQSSNEELQTSKEELQSVNEELETINTELSNKVSELDQANGDLENLFQATQIPTLFLDGSLHIKRFTTAAKDVFRLIDTDVGRPITDIAPRFEADLLPDMQDLLRTLAPKARQVRLSDGSSTYIVRMLPYRRMDQTVDGLVVTFFDVTQLEAAQEQRARLAAIVASSHDAIVSRTLEGTITSWNEAAAQMFGYTEQEAVGKSIYDLVTPPDQRTEIDRTDAMLRQGERVAPFEAVRLTKDGTRVAVWVAVSPVKDAAGTLIGSSAVFRDLTEVKRAQDLQEEAQRKDHFLSVLSHELRGPLASLRICVDILQRAGPEGARSQDAMAMADRQLEHLAGLVDQLLDASRIASGKITLNRSDENLVDVVRTSAEDQRGLLEAAGLRLDLSLPGTPLWVSCDPLRIAQIVYNLLGNAAKFTDRRGLVTLSLRRHDDGQSALLSVRDDGVGIEPSLLGRLFEPFSQGELPLDRGRSGLGLGLALVHALVTAHGGTVEARSEGRGSGAEFIVRLPLIARPATPTARPQPRSAPKAPIAPRRVLVVEDDWDAAEALRSVIELAGHTVEVAPDGPTALAKVLSFRPDVVVCDVGLPRGMDGHAVAAAIRGDAAYGNPQLIALSGYGQPADKARARAAGFDQHVTKAEHPRTLLDLIADPPPPA
jgi:two-component system CheB/CheR fusion protein